MSNTDVVHARAQKDFRQALECEPKGTLLVLNERGAYVIPVAHRDTPFPEVVVRDEAALIGGHLPLHITVFDGGEISVENVASVKADTDGRINVADTPKVTILSAGGATVKNCGTVVANKGVSLAAYDCGQVIIEEEPDVADA
jgi:hypothetical protein|nr:MAG TPA: hypothetical protein [Caudoviricetes sp.]